MNISEFMESQNISHDEFAKRCGVVKSTVYLWQKGKSIPSDQYMRIIEDVTNGLVTEKQVRKFFYEKRNELLDISDASKALRVKPPTLRKAIRDGKIGAQKVDKKWRISAEEIEKYKKNKYNPEERLVGGKRIWNVLEGKISPQHAAKMLGVTLQKIYLMIRIGRIQTEMINGYHVINSKDIEDIKNDVEELAPLF